MYILLPHPATRGYFLITSRAQIMRSSGDCETMMYLYLRGKAISWTIPTENIYPASSFHLNSNSAIELIYRFHEKLYRQNVNSTCYTGATHIPYPFIIHNL